MGRHLAVQYFLSLVLSEALVFSTLHCSEKDVVWPTLLCMGLGTEEAMAATKSDRVNRRRWIAMPDGLQV